MSRESEGRPPSQAGPESRGYVRTMTWRDGFSLALVVPVAIFATIGPAIGGIGSGALAAVFGIACLIAIIQNFIYAEMASMFPDKPGGIILYAHEAWKKYCTPLSVVAAFSYWAAWSLGNAVFALTAGDMLHAQFFSDNDWAISTGPIEITVAHLIAAGSLVLVWTLNAFGVKQAVFLNKVIGVLAVALILLLAVVPFVTGDFRSENVTWGLGLEGQEWGGWQLAMAFLFVCGWSSYGTETVAAFGPEYKKPKSDLPKGLLSAGLFTLVVAVLMPLGLGGTVGDANIAADPAGVYATAFSLILGPASGIVTILIVLSLLLVMNSTTATAGRALYGISADGLTIMHLDRLNKRDVPSRAMLIGLVLNLATVLLLGNVLALIFAANIGYFVATIIALIGFFLLRKDQPQTPRSFRVPRFMLPIAAVIIVINTATLAVGFLYPEAGGYGGPVEQLTGIVIILSSLALYGYRKLVQERRLSSMPR